MKKKKKECPRDHNRSNNCSGNKNQNSSENTLFHEASLLKTVLRAERSKIVNQTYRERHHKTKNKLFLCVSLFQLNLVSISKQVIVKYTSISIYHQKEARERDIFSFYECEKKQDAMECDERLRKVSHPFFVDTQKTACFICSPAILR